MRLSVWLRLGRVSNLPTVWSNVLAGVVLSSSAVSVGWRPLAALCLVMSAYYVGGMFLNDAFDAEIDARERPGRPIPAGLVSRRVVFVVGFATLALATAGLMGVAFWAGGSPGLAGLSGLALAGLIVFYDAYHKENPLSPVVMGLCRVGVYVAAALSVTKTLELPVVWGAACLLGYLVGLTYAAKQEAFNRLRAVWPLSFLAAPLVYAALVGPRDTVALGVALAFLFWQLSALKFLWPGPDRAVPQAVVRMIAGIAMVDALFIAAAGEVVLALVAFALCGLTRIAQQFVPGT